MNKYMRTPIFAIVLVAVSVIVLTIESYAQRTSTTPTSIDRKFIPIIPKLVRRVQIPIRLPDSLESFSDGISPVQVRLEDFEVDANTYSIIVETKGCDGAYVCLLGYIEGEAITPDNRGKDAYGIRVNLAKGIKGSLDLPDRAANHPMSSIVWKQGNVYYSISMLASRQTIIKVANSMILSSPINTR